MTMEPTYANIFLLTSRAKMNFQMKKLELANEQASTAIALFDSYPTGDEEWDNLCASLAELTQMMGQAEACELFMKKALAKSKPSGIVRGEREAFYARFLYSQGRLEEAESHALAAIAAPCGEVEFMRTLLVDIRAARAAH